MGVKIDVLVRYFDGDEQSVTVGQRELAAFEAQPFYNRAARYLMLRYAAFDGLRRAGRLRRDRKDRQVTWEEWDDQVDEVVDGEDEEEPDPTQPGPPAAS